MNEKPRRYLRFTRSYIIEHGLLTLSFAFLAVSGLAQRFPEVLLSRWFVGALAGVENVRLFHRVAAVLMMLQAIYHLGAAGYRVFVLRARLSMMPGMQDVRAAFHWLLYNLGLSRSRPAEGRYTFVEKAEYWAVVWGTVVMGITGFMLWNPIATARVLPGEAIPAAKAAHSAEAVLAALAIIVWHFYHVHIKVFNTSMFDGNLTEQQMAHEHPLELAAIQAGQAERPADSQALGQRRRVYLRVYGVLAALMLWGVVYFVTFEETALATVSPIEQAEVYVPLTATPLPTPLPTATPLPDGAISWEGGLGELSRDRCGDCHNSAAASGGLDVTSYEKTLAGGVTGVGVEPGDPDASQVVVRQVTGDHPGQFSGDELALVRWWIEAGAPRE